MNFHQLYPRYVERRKVDEVFASRCTLRAYENLRNISKVARLFGTTRRTVRIDVRILDKCAKLVTQKKIFIG